WPPRPAATANSPAAVRPSRPATAWSWPAPSTWPAWARCTPARCSPATSTTSSRCCCARTAWRSTGTTNCWRRPSGPSARRRRPDAASVRRVAGRMRVHPGLAFRRGHRLPALEHRLALGLRQATDVIEQGPRLASLLRRHVVPAAHAVACVLALLGRHRLPAPGVFEHVLALLGRAGVPALAHRRQQQFPLLLGEAVPFGQQRRRGPLRLPHRAQRGEG